MGSKSVLLNMKCVRIWIILLLLSVNGDSSQCPEKCDCGVKTTKLECRHQQMTQLPKGPFTRLEYLDLSGNRIPFLKDQMFVNQLIYTIDTLILAENTISSIEEHAFEGLSSLTYLDISRNDVGYFKASIFEHTRKIRTLKMNNNPGLILPEDSIELPILTKFTLNDCSLTHLPDNFFQHFSLLEHINLSHNKLTYFDSKKVGHLTKLQRIDLNNNRITNLHLALDRLPKSITILNLLNNPWHCDCELNLAYPLYKSTLYKQDIKCSSPQYLDGKVIDQQLVESIVCTTTALTETPAITTETADIIENEEEELNADVEHVTVMHIEQIGVFGKSEDLKVLPPMIDSKDADTEEVVEASWIGSNQWWIILACGLVVMCGVIFVIHRQVMKIRQRSPMGKSREDLEENGYHSVISM